MDNEQIYKRETKINEINQDERTIGITRFFPILTIFIVRQNLVSFSNSNVLVLSFFFVVISIRMPNRSAIKKTCSGTISKISADIAYGSLSE
jgi:hypothetical protein